MPRKRPDPSKPPPAQEPPPRRPPLDLPKNLPWLLSLDLGKLSVLSFTNANACWEDQVNTDFIAGLIVGVSIGLMLLWLLRRRRPPNA